MLPAPFSITRDICIVWSIRSLSLLVDQISQQRIPWKAAELWCRGHRPWVRWCLVVVFQLAGLIGVFKVKIMYGILSSVFLHNCSNAGVCAEFVPKVMFFIVVEQFSNNCCLILFSFVTGVSINLSPFACTLTWWSVNVWSEKFLRYFSFFSLSEIGAVLYFFYAFWVIFG